MHNIWSSGAIGTILGKIEIEIEREPLGDWAGDDRRIGRERIRGAIANRFNADVGGDIVAAMCKAAGQTIRLAMVGLSNVVDGKAATADARENCRPTVHELARIGFSQPTGTAGRRDWSAVVVSVFDYILTGEGLQRGLQVAGLLVLTDV